MGALRLLVALLAALRCLRLAIPCQHPPFRSDAVAGALPHRPGLWCAGVPPALPAMEPTSSPRFLGHPFRICPALRPRPGRRAKPVWHSGAAPADPTTKAPAFIFLSRFNHTASAVAVYASPAGSPPPGARLASGCRLRSTGWDWLPTGRLREVSYVLTSFLLSQAWPGAIRVAQGGYPPQAPTDPCERD